MLHDQDVHGLRASERRGRGARRALHGVQAGDRPRRGRGKEHRAQVRLREGAVHAGASRGGLGPCIKAQGPCL
jgi:hypothetical protein